MGRTKTYKEYTIKLIHPEFGEHYLYYIRNNYGAGKIDHSYIFTKNLNKVTKWKTFKYVESEMEGIKKRLTDNKCNILLDFGSEVKEELIPIMIYSRKKYYFDIKFAASQKLIDTATNNITALNISLLNDSNMITEAIKNCNHVEKDFIKIIKKFQQQIVDYRTDYYFLEKCKNNGVIIDIVDASYGFRLTKLKTLKLFSETNDEIEE